MYSNVAKTIPRITRGVQNTDVNRTIWYVSSAFIFNPFSLSTFQSSPQILDRPTQNHPNTKRSTIGVQATAKIIQTSLNCSSSCSFLIMPSILEPGPGQGKLEKRPCPVLESSAESFVLEAKEGSCC